MHSTYAAPVVTRTSASYAGSFYRPELDVMRFFAFFGVFLFHAAPRSAEFYEGLQFPSWVTRIVLHAFAAGGYGVDLFFALSAYLITSLLLRERATTGDLDLRSFYVRRILRIWPLYLGFVVFATLIPFLTHGPRLPLKYIAGYSLLAGNWIYVIYGLPVSVAIPLWTVSIEEQFYLTWPLAFRRASTRQMVKIALGILLIANICRFLLATYGGTVQAMEYSTLTRLDPIGMGILVALLGDKLPRFSTWQRVALLSIGIGVWISVSAFCSPDRLDIANVWKLTLGLPLTALASVAILLSVIGSRHFLLRSKSLKYLGKISYGLYVVHMFALSLAARVIHGSTRLAIGTQVGFGLILAILLAAASYRWLESPFLKLKERFSYVQSRPI